MVLDVAQLEALLAKTFNLGMDVGRGKEKVALVRLRLAKALIGVAEANALAAESIAIERGISTEEIARAEGLALHAAAFNGMPDPVFHMTARATSYSTPRSRPRRAASCSSSVATASPPPAPLIRTRPPHAWSTPPPN